jgi:hypothetical protein
MAACLSLQEREHFYRHGYVIKPSVLSPQQLENARELLWRQCDLPESRFSRHEPKSWTPFTDAEAMPQRGGAETDDALGAGEGGPMNRRGYGFWISTVNRDPVLLDLLPRCVAVRSMAEQLLGPGRLVQARGLAQAQAEGLDTSYETGQGTRGIYCTLARADDVLNPRLPCEHGARGGGPRGGHWDHKFHPGSSQPLLVSTYLDDVPPGGGALVVYPGSHHRNWRAALDEARGVRGWKTGSLANGDADDEVANEIMADTWGVECHAPAGSLVFWHANLLHGAGINRVPGTLRQSVIYVGGLPLRLCFSLFQRGG